MAKHTNHLVHETSPYLLQHAHNPVDWYPWADEALMRARTEDKPILVSIGYAACHWCHVMERESFENEATAAFMNEHFINIKIDREERPDLDHIYMDAVQAIAGNGGWPLNAFLTPEGKPFYGGTYYPPVRAYNRSSWTEVLTAIADAFKNKRSEIEEQAENLVQHLDNANSFGTLVSSFEEKNAFFSKKTLDEIVVNLLKNGDKEWGGFGAAPKFPQTFSIQFLLRHHHFTGDKISLEAALHSLDKMIQGGIYDQVGGGFARYSTDKKWLAPHFEKMLYDNALLISVLAEAYQLTKKEQYATVIDETISFVKRELLSPDYGFYSALDADSEGIEGKFYTWSKAEIEAIIGDDANLFCRLYDVSEEGNWEETNILWLPDAVDVFAQKENITIGELRNKIKIWKAKLLEERAKRERPLLDDKILLSWNALMNVALVKAYAALGNESYLHLAVKNMQFLEENLKTADGWMHTFKNSHAKYSAFLDDYAYLVHAYIALQEATGDTRLLDKAAEVITLLQRDFAEEKTGYFYFTAANQSDIIVRKKEVYDGATPSGNASAAYALLYLSVVLDRPDWKELAVQMVSSLGNTIMRYPGSFGVWAAVLQLLVIGQYEIAIVGEDALAVSAEVLAKYIPNKVMQFAVAENDRYPLLQGKPSATQARIYLCSGYNCKAPVATVPELMGLL